MKNTETQPESPALTTDVLIAAYSSGFFPMADARDGTIGWYSPDPRAIIPIDTFGPPRSLRQTMKKRLFEWRMNTSFEEVIRACGTRCETWISEEIIQSYLGLHRQGYAHSIEVWRDGMLAGGLYGVALGAAFFGESMFSRMRDASKVALVILVERLRARNFELLDTQFTTPHLARFGTIEIPREMYLQRLAHALKSSPRFIDG